MTRVRWLPGLTLAAVGAAAGYGVHLLLPGLPWLTAALILGVLAGSLPPLRKRLDGPLAPGLALAHARPGPDVLADGLAVVTLATPVSFGHPHNDPVSVVLGLAIKSADTHIEAVAELANVFNDSSTIARLTAAASVEEVLQIMGGTT